MTSGIMNAKVVTWLLLWTAASCQQYPFQDTSLSFEQRVDDLVSRLTVDEMMLQMAKGGTGEYGGPAPSIPRLGIGPYRWDSECIRGAARAKENATAFPQAIGLAATFSPKLVYDVAVATGKEVRGKHNDFVKRGIYAHHTGASCFSPVVNIARDSRWGRIQETYGECPFMSGILAQQFIYGLQGNHSRYVQATSGCKHLNVHSGPEELRLAFDAQVDDYDWRMSYLPAFRKCVQAGTYSFMCSYNKVNGIPACAHKELLTDILRTEWNFTGYVVSDHEAITDIITYHHYVDNFVDAAAVTVNAGCNLEVHGDRPQNVYMSIADAVSQGKITEETLRERVKPLFYTRMKLGEFDPTYNNPYAKLSNDDVETPEHQALAIEAALQTFVLLKNYNDFLPIEPDDYSSSAMVGVIGPMADNYDQLFGDYRPNQDRSFTKTPLEGIKEIFATVRFGKACVDGNRCTDYNPDVVRDTVSGTALVIVALGTGGTDIEMEFHDRPTLDLPGNQEQLLRDVISFSGSSKIVLLLFNSGPLNLTFAEESDRIDSIVECFLPSQGAGDAIAKMLTNGSASPGGRLPLTWPRYEWQMPPSVNYSMEGRTYRYLDTDPLYPFGYGLSYSRFQYDELELTDLQSPQEDLQVSLKHSNVGKYNADEVIQCYIEWDNKTLRAPLRQLVYFERMHMRQGMEMTHKFSIAWDNWAIRDNGEWLIQEGPMTLYCGGQQPNQSKTVPSNVVSAQFNIPSTVRLSTLI